MRIIWLIVAAALIASCSQNNDFVTESGVEVTCVVKGDDGALIQDSIAVLYLKMTAMGDTEKVLMEAGADQPLALAFDSAMQAGHIQEVLNGLEVGDSVTFETTAQNLFEETYKTQVPPDLTPETVVKVQMRLAMQMSKTAYSAYSRELQEKARAKESIILGEKVATDGTTIDNFLDSLSVEATTTESGLRYIITEDGSGPTANPGDAVTVHYDGRLLSGEPFDSSRERGEPFTFNIGQGRVIPGWDEGIAYIKEGGKATLYIPSPLAYGARSPSPSIPAYSILVFDVEVLKVEGK